jgi:hypothetical protein
MIELKNLIQAYISERESFYDQERYKWEAVKSFQENYLRSDILLDEKLYRSFAVADNLLASNNYYPARMLCFFAKEKADETQKGLDELFSVSLPLSDRVSSFIRDIGRIFRTMQEEGYRDWKGRTNVQSFQDTHAVSVYLSLRFPNLYYIYKWSVFKVAAEKLGYTIKSKDKVGKLVEFYDFCETIKSELIKEKEFLKDYHNKLKAKGYTDDNNNLLTQDFVYAVARYLNADVFRKDGSSIVGKEKAVKSSDYSSTVHKVEDEFRAKKGIDYAKQDMLFRDLGKKGEMWVVNYEKERLSKLGIIFDVRHASLYDGDGLGYDVLSVEDDGVTPRYIEVKTTTGGVGRPFYFTQNELERSIKDADHYYLYRVCNFKSVSQKADILIIKGSLAELNATPITYEVSIKK